MDEKEGFNIIGHCKLLQLSSCLVGEFWSDYSDHTLLNANVLSSLQDFIGSPTVFSGYVNICPWTCVCSLPLLLALCMEAYAEGWPRELPWGFKHSLGFEGTLVEAVGCGVGSARRDYLQNEGRETLRAVTTSL